MLEFIVILLVVVVILVIFRSVFERWDKKEAEKEAGHDVWNWPDMMSETGQIRKKNSVNE